VVADVGGDLVKREPVEGQPQADAVLERGEVALLA